VKLTKNQYLLYFVVVVALLAVVRLVFPDVASSRATTVNGYSAESAADPATPEAAADPSTPEAAANPSTPEAAANPATPESAAEKAAARRYHPIRGVVSYKDCFPDAQEVQITAAQQWGVRPVRNREEAEARMRELVYVNVSPYYHVDRMSSSIPYLVPRAALLLQDVGQAFYDSLYQKGIPLHQLIVTSVLRTKDDVERLQRHNQNATENSCHMYGTTFDICYNRYRALGREVTNDTLKWILSEVLRDQRELGRCYVKHEVKQGCFHMTVR